MGQSQSWTIKFKSCNIQQLLKLIQIHFGSFSFLYKMDEVRISLRWNPLNLILKMLVFKCGKKIISIWTILHWKRDASLNCLQSILCFSVHKSDFFCDILSLACTINYYYCFRNLKLFLKKNLCFFSFSDALDKAEKATQRLATVSKDVIKALEVANPKETKK